MPELTIPMAMVIIDYLGIKRNETILDIGCAKGFLVKAFRWLGREAYGYDISYYALSNADPEVKGKVFLSDTYPNCKYAVAKDTFEHFEEDNLRKFLSRLNTEILFIMVPLGDGEKFIVPQYEMDKTHKIRQPLSWWEKTIEECGWEIDRAEHRIPGLKDNWADHKQGNAFITANKKNGT